MIIKKVNLNNSNEFCECFDNYYGFGFCAEKLSYYIKNEIDIDFKKFDRYNLNKNYIFDYELINF